MAAPPPPIKALIVDAGPLIASTSTAALLARAAKVYTTPSALAEVRDAAARARLETTWLPFLEQRAPRPASVRAVAEFAKRTGDFAALSVTDLQLLALTYELECEGNGGDWRLRSVPGQKGVNGPVPGREKKKKEEEEEEVEVVVVVEGETAETAVEGDKAVDGEAGAETDGAAKTEAGKDQAEPETPTTAAESNDAAAEPARAGSSKTARRKQQRLKAKQRRLEQQEEQQDTQKRGGAAAAEDAGKEEVEGAAGEAVGETPKDAIKPEAPAVDAAEAQKAEAPKPEAEAEAEAEAAPRQTAQEAPAAAALSPDPDHDPDHDPDPASDSSTDGPDNGGWITAENLRSHQHKDAHPPLSSTPSRQRWPMAAALATTDYAMQNVLLQMNLHLVSPGDLHRIRTIKTWVLRCHACFKLCRDTDRQFCPTCGGHTLLRTSCSTDSAGAFRVHLKRDMRWNNRGNVYAIPKTQHGSASGKGVRRNLVLREDQVEYQRELRHKQRQKERDLLDPDYLPGILTGERRDMVGAMPTVGYGRKNPNERQGGRNKH